MTYGIEVEGAEYFQALWGDCIRGTKAQLQALGLGVGLAFPGEPGGHSYLLKTKDPRGYAVDIRRRGADAYSASIRFTGWPQVDRSFEDWQQFAPGVKMRRYPLWDEYRGTPEALAAAGVVRAEQLPGQPGMRPKSVTVLADGSTLAGAPTAKTPQARAPGVQRIYKAAGRPWLAVYVNITEDEKQHRRALELQASAAWRAQVEALPRPAMLRPGMAPNVIRIELRRPTTDQAPASRLAALGAFLAGGAGSTAQVLAFPGAMR